MILEFGHTSTLRDAVESNVPGAATHDWEVRFLGLLVFDTVAWSSGFYWRPLVTVGVKSTIAFSSLAHFAWNISYKGATYDWEVSFDHLESLGGEDDDCVHVDDELK